MYIESPKRILEKSQKDVYEFLTDLKNFEQLMPDSISKFEVLNEDRFLFQLKGMPEIVLERKEETPHSQIILGAASQKLPFTLTTDIVELDEEQSEVILSFSGKFNTMMRMMIKSPITNFISTLSENLDRV